MPNGYSPELFKQFLGECRHFFLHNIVLEILSSNMPNILEAAKSLSRDPASLLNTLRMI